MGLIPIDEERDLWKEISQGFEFHPTKPSEMVVLLLAPADETIGKYHSEIGRQEGRFEQA